MRYIIGYEAIDKKKLKNPDNPYIEDNGCKGLYAFGWLDYILNEKTRPETIEKTKLMVFEDLEEAKKEISALSKAYRRDDVAFSPQIKSRYIRHFYLIKLDSPKCPVIIDESSREKSKKGNFYWYKIKQLRS